MRTHRQRATSKPSSGVPLGIGIRNEKSLHAALKQWYARPGDQFEIRVDGFIVDILRDEACIEIQTQRLSAIKRKLQTLLAHRCVHLIYPIAREKWIVRVTARSGKVIGRRKSTRKGQLIDLFDELVGIADLARDDKLKIIVAMVSEEEVRRVDGKGSWRRRGQSIQDRKLLNVLETITFEEKQDFMRFLPEHLAQPFSNASLAACAGMTVHTARKITYCLKKMQVIQEVGKDGRRLLFKIAEPDTQPYAEGVE